MSISCPWVPRKPKVTADTHMVIETFNSVDVACQKIHQFKCLSESKSEEISINVNVFI